MATIQIKVPDWVDPASPSATPWQAGEKGVKSEKSEKGEGREMEGKENSKLQITNNKQISNTKEPIFQTALVNVTFKIPEWLDPASPSATPWQAGEER